MLRPAGRDQPREARFVARPRTRCLTLSAIEDRLGPERKRRLGLSRKAKLLVNESAEESGEQWLRARKKHQNHGLTVAQRRKMRKFFDDLDEDGSGHISVEELLGPLLAFGLASSENDVRAFVTEVDEDASGQICYDEFIRALVVADKKQKQKQAAASAAAARRKGAPRAAHKLRVDVGKGGLKAVRSLPALQIVQRGADGQLLHQDANFKKRQMSMAAMGIARRRHRTKEAAHPLAQLQQASSGGSLLELDTLISLRRRERLMATIERSLPTTGDIEGIRWEEQRLRQRLFNGGGGGGSGGGGVGPGFDDDEASDAASAAREAAELEAEAAKLQTLQKHRLALLETKSESNELIAALERAVRVDQQMAELHERQRRGRAPPTKAGRTASVQLAPLSQEDLHGHRASSSSALYGDDDASPEPSFTGVKGWADAAPDAAAAPRRARLAEPLSPPPRPEPGDDADDGRTARPGVLHEDRDDGLGDDFDHTAAFLRKHNVNTPPHRGREKGDKPAAFRREMSKNEIGRHLDLGVLDDLGALHIDSIAETRHDRTHSRVGARRQPFAGGPSGSDGE